MNERPQINLRPRKPFPYLPPDTQDPDLIGYHRSNFNKDVVSPALELNSNAKILVKFLNSTNKALRQFVRSNDDESRLNTPIEHPINERQVLKGKARNEGNRKVGSSKNNPEEDIKVQKKQPYNIRDQNQSSIENMKLNQKQDYGKGKHQSIGRVQQPSNLIQQYTAFLNQMNPNGLSFDLNGNGLLEAFSQHNLEFASKALQQQQKLLTQSQIFPIGLQNTRIQNQPQKQQRSNESQEKESKLFGRSAYHVAIAYHIHLKKIKQSGQEMVNKLNLDPTYSARKLKGQKVKNDMAEQ